MAREAGTGRHLLPRRICRRIGISCNRESSNEAERAASEDLQTQKFSDTQRVRLKLFPLPAASLPSLLAIVQYNFAGANPAMSCLSIGLMVQLVRNAGNWEVRSRYLLETMHHSSIQKLDLVELTRDGADE